MLRTLQKPSIRTKLTWMVLTLLIIPWMGYYYVLEMKRFLVQGQMDALLLTASGIATVLNDRPELFNPETGVPEVLGDEKNLYAHKLDNLIQMDGNAADWKSVQQHASYYTGDDLFMCDRTFNPDDFSLKNIMGFYDNYLYALFQITDDQLIFRDLEKRSLDGSDQIRILIQQTDGALSRYVAVAAEPGRMAIFLVDEKWQYPLEGSDVTDFTAELAETKHGYQIELRIPREVIGFRARMGFFVSDIDDVDNQQAPQILSTSPQISGEEPGQILLTSPELTKILHGLDRPQSRIWILDTSQRVRAVVGRVSPANQNEVLVEKESNWLLKQKQFIQNQFDALLNRPPEEFMDVSHQITHRPDKIFTTILKGEPRVAERPSLDEQAQIIVAGYPIKDGEKITGAVIVEQSSHAILSLQYQLLRSLTVVTILVFFFILVVLFIFTWRLSVRVRKLYNTTEQAITLEGKVLEDKIPNRIYPMDELGDLGRSITSMLKRLSGYTRYLEGMPDTLAHEMNNPLNVVSSSLEILRSQTPDIVNNKHMQRAQNGVNRLRLILTNLTEAANLEEAMRGEVKTHINLAQLITECVDGYRSSHPKQPFTLDISSPSMTIHGSDDHIAQMLDKLVDNALQFTYANKPIIVRLEKERGVANISVLNEGPSLPEKIIDRIFDPMVSFGKTNAQFSHLGLGLFIVRLIVQYHEGTVQARNRKDIQGVEVTLSVPLTHNPFFHELARNHQAI